MDKCDRWRGNAEVCIIWCGYGQFYLSALPSAVTPTHAAEACLLVAMAQALVIIKQSTHHPKPRFIYCSKINHILSRVTSVTLASDKKQRNDPSGKVCLLITSVYQSIVNHSGHGHRSPGGTGFANDLFLSTSPQIRKENHLVISCPFEGFDIQTS